MMGDAERNVARARLQRRARGKGERKRTRESEGRKGETFVDQRNTTCRSKNVSLR